MSSGILETDSMFSARLVPWHGLGNILDVPYLRSHEVNEAAGINYTLSLRDFVMPNGDIWAKHKFVVRDDTGEVVAVVGANYEIVQPHEFPTAMDELVDNGEGQFTTAGSLFNQTRMFWDMELPDYFDVGGDAQERMMMHLLGITSFDESLKAGYYISAIRTVCNNTARMAMGSAKRSVTSKHTKNIRERLASSRHALGLAKEYRDVLQQVSDFLSQVKMDDTKIEHTLDMIEGTSLREAKTGEKKVQRALTTAQNRRDEFVAVLKRRDDLSRIRDNGWGFLQAAAEVNDHHNMYKTTKTSSKWDNRMNNILGLSSTNNFTGEAFDALDTQFAVLGSLGLKEEKRAKLHF